MTPDIAAKPVIIYTQTEIIRGTLYHAKAIRLSDFMNSRIASDSPFLSLTGATVEDRHTGAVLSQNNFMLLSRLAILMMYEEQSAETNKPTGDTILRPVTVARAI